MHPRLTPPKTDVPPWIFADDLSKPRLTLDQTVMIEEVSLFGGFVSVAFVLAVAAGIFSFVARMLLQRLSIDRFLWHPLLLDLTLFLTIWWGLSILADRFYPY